MGSEVGEAYLSVWRFETAPNLKERPIWEPLRPHAHSRPLPITLIRPGWPAGVCPIHMYERSQRCGGGCMPARVELAVIEADYLKYWGGLQ